MHASPMLSLSPTFTPYSNANLTQISTRVVERFNNNSQNETKSKSSVNDKKVEKTEHNDIEDRVEENEDFAFVVMNTESEYSPVYADEIFNNGQIRPFSSNNLSSYDVKFKHETLQTDVLECIPTNTICVWTPQKSAKESQCKKSNSKSNSVKPWKLPEFLHRSYNDDKENADKATTKVPKVTREMIGEAPPRVSKSGIDKRKSHFLHTKDLVRLFAPKHRLMTLD